MERSAYRVDGRGGIERTREPLAEMGPRDVRLAVAAVSLNFRDVPFVRGGNGRPPAEGRVPCSDAVGHVEAVGSEVTRVRVGDRVSPTILPRWLDGPLSSAAFAAGFGSRDRDGVLADRLIVEEDALVHVPAYLSDAEAATLPCAALTAWHTIVGLGAAQAGDTVAIETTGGVAVFAIQFALAQGLRPIVTSRSAEKLARATALGAAHTIDTTRTPAWHDEALAFTGGAGARLVVDMGLSGGLARSSAAAAFEGTVAIVGVVDGWSTTLEIGPVMNKNLRVRGVETGSRTMFERMNELLAGRALRPVIDRSVPFADADAAFARLRESPFGKVVVSLS